VEEIEILPLIGTVIYPQTVTPIAIAQPAAVRLVDSASGQARRIGVVTLRAAQRRPEPPSLDECYPIGTLALVHRLLRLPDGSLRVAIEGLERFALLELLTTGPTLRARVRALGDEPPAHAPSERVAQLKALAEAAAERAGGLSPALVEEIAAESEPQRLAYLVAASLLGGRPLAERQALLSLPTVDERLAVLIDTLRASSSAEPGRRPAHGGHGPDDLPPGRALWLRHTSAGSELAFIDAVRMSGDGELLVSGQRGRLARETVQIALSWLRAAAQPLGLDPDFYARSAIHVHMPAGALPDEQHAAGAAVALALASLLTRRPTTPSTVICGDLSLHGHVLPVRRLAEKLAVAHRAGISTLACAAAHAEELGSFGDLASDVRLLPVHNLAEALDELLV
jgi:ATP-dependent Lon protease